jgi:O-antigen/teichoic acid export membrane protein
LLNSFSTQVQTVLVAGYVGLGAAGVLRAMQLPMLAMVNALGAAGSLVLPVFSRDFGLGKIHQLRQKARLVSLVLGGGELCFVGLLALLAVPLERLLFGGKYASYAWMMPVLSAIPLFVAVSMGFAHSMRAAHKPHFDFLANAVAAPVAMLSSLLFIKKWGAGGAAASMVLASLVYMVCVMFIYYGQPKPAEQQGRDH